MLFTFKFMSRNKFKELTRHFFGAELLHRLHIGVLVIFLGLMALLRFLESSYEIQSMALFLILAGKSKKLPKNKVEQSTLRLRVK